MGVASGTKNTTHKYLNLDLKLLVPIYKVHLLQCRLYITFVVSVRVPHCKPYSNVTCPDEAL